MSKKLGRADLAEIVWKLARDRGYPSLILGSVDAVGTEEIYGLYGWSAFVAYARRSYLVLAYDELAAMARRPVVAPAFVLVEDLTLELALHSPAVEQHLRLLIADAVLTGSAERQARGRLLTPPEVAFYVDQVIYGIQRKDLDDAAAL